MRKVLLILLIAGVITGIMSLGVYARPIGPSALFVEGFVKDALGDHWQLLVNPGLELRQYYAPGDNHLIDSWRAKLDRHYLEPARRAGLEYASVTVDVEIRSLYVRSAEICVLASVSLTYDSKYPGSPPVVTKEVGIPCTLTLSCEGDAVKIAAFEQNDTYSKRASLSRGVGPSGGESASASTPGILGWYLYYDRQGAAAYAEDWWDGRNSEYRNFPEDCANFVSQCFKEGGNALEATVTPYVWWYDFNGPGQLDDTWSYSWAVAHDQAYHLSRNADVDEHRGTYVASATDLEVGDSIYYDLDGDGILDHSAIVVLIQNDQPYVNYHTTDTYHRHWDLGAYTTRFLKVTDYYWIS